MHSEGAGCLTLEGNQGNPIFVTFVQHRFKTSKEANQVDIWGQNCSGRRCPASLETSEPSGEHKVREGLGE